jgi:preprotein translocase subunit SecD
MTLATRWGTETLHVRREVVLDGGDLLDARAEGATGANRGLHSVRLRFTEGGARKLHQITSSAVGKRLAIIVDDEPLTAPVISRPITEQEIALGTYLKRAEAQQVASKLRRALRRPHAEP